MKTKMRLITALKIWVIIYPSITVLLYLLAEIPLILPLYQKTLLLTLVLVPWVVFIGVPFVDFIIHLILQKNEKDKPAAI